MERRLLIKFGQEEHINRLQQEGFFYCKDIRYFVELEDGKTRGDDFETVVELRYIEQGTLKLKPVKDVDAEWKELHIENALIRKHFPNPLGNLFCMSSLRVHVSNEPSVYELDERFHTFGTHFLLITNQVLFEQRLRAALKNLTITYEDGLVEYLDLHRYTGEKHLFQKDLQYAWQEEYRFYFDTDKAEPFGFTIGSIEDISTIYELSKNSKFWLKCEAKNFGR